jgi:hypothetical protein
MPPPRQFEVDPRAGLSSTEGTRRLQRHGANRRDETPRGPRWRAFLRQFQDLLILILLVAPTDSAAPDPDGGRPPRGGALAVRGPLPYAPVLEYGTASGHA